MHQHHPTPLVVEHADVKVPWNRGARFERKRTTQTHGLVYLVCGLVNSQNIEQTVDWRTDFGKNPPVGIPATDISVRGAAKGLRIFSERHELASVKLDHSSTLRYLRVSKSLMLNCCLSLGIG